MNKSSIKRMCRLYGLTVAAVFTLKLILGLLQTDTGAALGVYITDTKQDGHLYHDKHEELSKNGLHLCESTRKPSQSDIHYTQGGVWQKHNENSSSILLYSAFYDDRPETGILPWIRILGVAANFKQGYCQVWYPDTPRAYISEVVILKSGRGDNYNGSHYAQIQMSCKLPSARPIPSHVSVVVSPCVQSSTFLSVNAPNRQVWTHEFGICVAIAFGNIDQDQVIEWAELSSKLGVSEINIYNATISSKYDPLFNYYEKERKLMRVHQMPPPVPLYDKKGAKFGSPASLNDCMLRYMYRYRYIIVIDFDEVIVPTENYNYSSLVKAIDKANPKKTDWLSYTFRNTHFFRDFKADTNQPESITSLRYRTRMNPDPYGYAPKSFVNPRRCISVFNHYCYVRYPNSPSPFTIDVNPTLAKSHHYKHCNFGKVKCTEMMSKNTTDDVMLRYKDYIIERTDHVKKKLPIS